jgi:hypothetical protein
MTNQESKILKKEERMRAVKLTFIIMTLSLLFVLVGLFSNQFIFTLVVLGLLYDYFVLLGGNLFWLNRILDDKGFHGTGIYRRMLAADAKMIIIAVFSGLVLIYFDDSQSSVLHSNSCSQHAMDVWEFVLSVIRGDFHTEKGLPFFIYIFMIKMYILGQLTHSIHHIIINEKLTGMRFTGYIPITSTIKRIMRWGRA